MYNIAICGCDMPYIHHIESLFETAGINTPEVSYHEFTTGKDFLGALDYIDNLDLLILDLQIYDIYHISVAEKFRLKFPHSLLVYCSDTFIADVSLLNTSPFKYLIKKNDDLATIEDIKDIISELKYRKPVTYLLSSHFKSHISFTPYDILYISKGRNCSIIHFRAGFHTTTLNTKKKLSELYILLKAHGFEYAHSSYIVNLNHIIFISRDMIKLSDDSNLAISRSKMLQFNNAYANQKTKL